MSEKNIKILKLFIAFFVIICLILGIIIYYFMKNGSNQGDKKNENSNLTDSEEPYESDIEIDDKTLININNTLVEVSSVEEYFRVKSCIDKYFEFISYLNISDQYDYTEETKNEMRKENFEEMYLMLDDEYINEQNITLEKLSQMYTSYCETKFITNKMYKQDLSGSIHAYVLYGKYVESQDQYKVKDYSVIIRIDEENKTFSIYLNDYLEKKNYLKLTEGKSISINNTNRIENKEFNVYNENDIDTSNLALVKYYFQLYRDYLAIDLEYSYNLLDNDYKNLRFETYDEYKKYMATNLNEMSRYTLAKYKTNTYPGYTQFICLDENNNYYIINVTKPGTFTICLDNYTILSGVDEATYEDSFPNSRCTFNVNRFLKGINNQNYNFSYSVLADSFKTSKYATKEDFIKFVQENLFKQNEIESIEWSMTNEEIYKGEAIIVDATGESSKKINMTFLVDLKSGTNFELSFTKE